MTTAMATYQYRTSRVAVGTFFLLLGAAFLLDSFGVFRVTAALFWPLFVISLGAGLLLHRARRMQVEEDRSAQLAVAEERVRIARELHDIVAHGVSLMTIQIAAARRVGVTQARDRHRVAGSRRADRSPDPQRARGHAGRPARRRRLDRWPPGRPAATAPTTPASAPRCPVFRPTGPDRGRPPDRAHGGLQHARRPAPAARQRGDGRLPARPGGAHQRGALRRRRPDRRAADLLAHRHHRVRRRRGPRRRRPAGATARAVADTAWSACRSGWRPSAARSKPDLAGPGRAGGCTPASRSC